MTGETHNSQLAVQPGAATHSAAVTLVCSATAEAADKAAPALLAATVSVLLLAGMYTTKGTPLY